MRPLFGWAWALTLLAWGAGAAAGPGPEPPGEGPWTPVFAEDGISVWERPVAGRDLPVYRATGTLPENMYEVIAVLNDFSRHREWMRFMRETRILWRPDELHLVVYILFDAPWPVWDRDAVVKVDVTVGAGRREAVFRFARTSALAVPQRDEVVRVPQADIYARLRYVDAQHTEVDAWMDVDPAGQIPRWLVRWFTRRIPLEALRRLRAQVEATDGQYEAFLNRWDPDRAGRAGEEQPAALPGTMAP